MYLIIFNIILNVSYTNAYGDIKRFMTENNFIWQQGSVYFGNDNITAVSCVLTVQRLARQYPWFSTCVKDVRMLRIEENNDLMPAIL